MTILGSLWGVKSVWLKHFSDDEIIILSVTFYGSFDSELDHAFWTAWHLRICKINFGVLQHPARRFSSAADGPPESDFFLQITAYVAA